MNERLTLSELNSAVKKVLSASFTAPVWVIGEISEITIHSNGHCYLTLIEKGDADDRIAAQARATIWSYTFRMLRPYFETTTGQSLTDGIKVLLQVSVEFHELYGYSLNVRNIDPTYTLGDQARKRMEIIRRLTDEGVITMNKELDLPLVPQRIAIISSPSAAGYGDFMEQLTNNKGNYCFYTQLFPAVMQGNQAEQSIVDALDRIYPYEDFFDLVVIIRGGGSQVDLSCFDNYNVAYYITQFPIPVLTGIGHEKDDSIVDMVAHTRLKTPTAVAEFILDGVSAFEERVNLLEQEAVGIAQALLEDEMSRLDQLTLEASGLVRASLANRRTGLMRLTWRLGQEARLAMQDSENNLGKKLQKVGFLVNHYIFSRKQKIDRAQYLLDVSIPRSITAKEQYLREYLEKGRRLSLRLLEKKKHWIDIAAQKGEMSDPGHILKKGYTITTSRGRLVKKLSILSEDDTIQTQFFEGIILSRVTEIQKQDKNDN